MQSRRQRTPRFDAAQTIAIGFVPMNSPDLALSI
jgi:hypothetical protein